MVTRGSLRVSLTLLLLSFFSLIILGKFALRRAKQRLGVDARKIACALPREELDIFERALITRGFGEHAAAMEDVANVLSKNERLTLLRLLKKLGKHAAETRN